MSGALAALPCRPCRGDTPIMTPDAVALRITEIPGWTLCDDGRRIERRLRFADFAQAFDFVRRVAELAEAAGHHPDLTLGWGYATMSLQTHAIGGLHLNDFILAARIDSLL